LAQISDIVTSLHPSVSGVGIITTDQIWVLFDRELDETTVAGGNFFVTGPDFDTWSGPDLQIWLDAPNVGEENEILQSPGYNGIVQGDITFQRISNTSLSVISGIDITGSGHLYRTKAIFTPRERLAPSTEYRVYLSGDEDNTDSLETGVFSRTIFDPVSSGANTGSGVLTFAGGYIGLVPSDTFRINITNTGGYDVGNFLFTRDGYSGETFGPFTIRRRSFELGDGVELSFSDSTFYAGDQYSVVVKVPEVFYGNLNWPFKTGTGSIETIPDTTATSVIATTTAGTAAAAPASFSVLSVNPIDQGTNIAFGPTDFTITVNFSSNIDPTTVVSGVNVAVTTEPVTGTTSDGIYPPDTASGLLLTRPEVSGSTLRIIVQSGQLFQNNLVIVNLGSSMANTDGVTLSSDYEYSWTTTYYPMYCSSRRLRLMAGNYLTGINDDALNLAIHLSSLESDQFTWNKKNLEDQYYHFVRSQWTCCRAAQYILLNTVGGSGRLKAKRLGDMMVEYDTNKVNINVPLQYMQECLDRFTGALLAGGRQVQTPMVAVKGDLDIDKPPIGRGWLHTRDWLNTQTPASNIRVKPSLSRRYRGAYGHRGWWEKNEDTEDLFNDILRLEDKSEKWK
jgi:hypothetical protein